MEEVPSESWPLRIRAAFLRTKQSTGCLFLYVFLVALNAFVLIWQLAGGGRHPMFLFIEGVINAFLLCEVLLTIFVQRGEYFGSVLNLIDLSLTIACLVLFFVFLHQKLPEGESAKDQLGSQVDGALLVIRFSFQLGRMIFLLYVMRQAKHTLDTGEDDVVFDEDARRIELSQVEVGPSMNSMTSQQQRPLVSPSQPASDSYAHSLA